MLSSLGFSQIGIKAGPVVSDIVFADEGQIPYLGYEVNSLVHKLPYLTYSFGVSKQFTVSDRVDVQMELLFSKKGLNYSSDFIYDDIKYYLDIYYLETPVLLKYNLKNTSLLIGPYAAYAINRKHVIRSNDYSKNEILKNVKDLDLGIAAGIAKEFKYGDHNIVVDFRLSYSLIDMMDHLENFKPEYYGAAKERAKNINIIFTVGYVFK